MILPRRSVLTGGAALLAGCDRVAHVPAARAILFKGEDMHRGLQRALTDRGALAPEFAADQRSPIFRSNGTRDPATPEYTALQAGRFADWRLRVGGLVARPLALSLADLGRFPQRAQITRHDCVEGWSAIAKWQGPGLRDVLKAAVTAAKGGKAPIRLMVERGDQYREVALDYHGGLRYPHLEKSASGEAGLDKLLQPR